MEILLKNTYRYSSNHKQLEAKDLDLIPLYFLGAGDSIFLFLFLLW